MGKPVLSKIDQIGVVVRDLDKAIEYYRSLGLGPFRSVSATVTERKVRGVPDNSWKFRLAVTDLGPVQFELVMPVAGETIHKKFLEEKGEGINHLGVFVDDIEKAQAELEGKGLKVIYSVRFLGGGGAAYFDTGEVGGVLFEVMQLPKK